MKRMSQYAPAMGVLALCFFNPWGFAALPDLGLILIGLFATATLVIAVRRGSLFVDKTMLVLGIAIATGLIASLASDAPLMSIFGGLTRSSGVVSMVVWFVAFWAGMQFNGDTTDRDQQLVWFGRASAVFALLVVLGRLGIPVVPSPDSARATGPLGSSAFSGSVLALTTPLCVINLFHQKMRERSEGFVLLGIQVMALIATGARASWLAAFIGAVISLVVMVKRRNDVNERSADFRQVAVGLVAVLFIGVFSLFAFDSTSRITNVGEENGTAAGRLVLWETGLRAVSHDPIFGVGFDQQESAIAESLPSDFEKRFDDSVIPDRAHNWFIDLWLGGGILTVIAMLLAFVVALRRSQRDLLGRAIQIGVIGYLLQAQFNFSLPGVEAAVWLLLGVAIAPQSRRVKLAIQPVVPIALVSVLLVAPFALNIVADTQLERGQTAELSGNLVHAQDLYESASSMASWQPALEEVVARFGMRNGDAALAQASAVEATVRSGGQLRWRELQGQTLLASGEYATARDVYQSLIEQRPTDSSLYVGLGIAHIGLADEGAAMVAFNTALQINPNSEQAQAGLAQISGG